MHEPLSPELALVDPDLAARARATLPYPERAPLRAVSRIETRSDAAAYRQVESSRPYPLWARVTAALWLLVVGVLIGGAAVPHAQDKPRVLPAAENPPTTICEPPSSTPPTRGGPVLPGP